MAFGFNLDSIFNFLGKYSDVAGNAFSAVTAVQSYMADREAERQTEKGNRAMMKAAEQEAALMKQDAIQKSASVRRTAQRQRAEQITSYLKSGVTLEGSPMLVLDETEFLGNQDADNVLTNSAYEQRAAMLRAEGNKRSVKKADFWGTGFDVLGSTFKAADAYRKMK